MAWITLSGMHWIFDQQNEKDMVEKTAKKKVVIIGGGLGGLSAAISLQTKGYAVELHEKNSHLVSKLNLVEKEGFSFDLGPSIYTFPYIFKNLFDMAGRDMDNYMQIVEPAVHWRCFFEDGQRIDLLRDVGRMEEANLSMNGEVISLLKDFLQYSKKPYDLVQTGYFEKGGYVLGDSMPMVTLSGQQAAGIIDRFHV